MRAILFDMDGVLYNSTRPIEGASETLAWLRAQAIPHLFVTNTSSHTRESLVKKLSAFRIQAAVEDIFTPPAAAAEWLRARDPGRIALFAPPKMHSEFADLDLLSADAEKDARYVVIGDLSEAWDFLTLNRAFRLLHASPEAELIALGMTKMWQAPDGLRMDVAPFVAALEHATGKKAIVFGKPSELFFLAAAKRLGLPPAEILMIGDDIEIDVRGAQRSGMKGALVRTGKFRPPDLESGTAPDAILDSVAAIPAWWGRKQT